MHDEAPLDLGSVARQGQLRGQLRIGGQILRLDMRINLEAAPVGIVHQDQRRPTLGGKIAGADILPVAAKVGDAERPVVEHADEAGRPATMLYVRPAALGHGRHIEAVALGDERGFRFSEAIRWAVALESGPVVSAAVGLLRGANPGRSGNVEESVSHGGAPRGGRKTSAAAAGLRAFRTLQRTKPNGRPFHKVQ